MKRLLLSLILTLVSLCGHSQSMSVASFEAETNDMDARVHHRKLDQNGDVAAIIKIETTEKGFSFDVGTLGVVEVDHNRVAETWVYVPRGIIQITILHEHHGRIKYNIPIAIQSATVYRLKLTTNRVTTIVEQSAGGQYLVVNSLPGDMQFTVDGGTPVTITGGGGNIFLSYGQHSYTASARYYRSQEGVITIGQERAELSISLEPNFGYINIDTTPSGAEVEINGMVVGETPYRSQRLLLGDHEIQISKSNYAPITETVTLSEGGGSVSRTHTMRSYMSNITIECADSDAMLVINNENRGQGGWSGQLAPGTYEIRAEKAGHRPAVERLVVEPYTAQTATLGAPTPMYGTLNVSSVQNDLTVMVDGKLLGKTPNIFSNILVGRHELTLSKDGFAPATATIEITEGRITQYHQDMLSDISGSSEYQDMQARLNAERAKIEAERAKREAREQKQKDKEQREQTTTQSPSTTYILPQIGFGAGTISYGAMVGRGNKFGGYVKYLSNFNPSKSDGLICDNSGTIYGTSAAGVKASSVEPNYCDIHVSHYSVSTGVMCRLAPWCNLYVGGGLGRRVVELETFSGEYIKMVYSSATTSYSVDGGVILRFGNLLASAGFNAVKMKYCQFNLGVGFGF